MKEMSSKLERTVLSVSCLVIVIKGQKITFFNSF